MEQGIERLNDLSRDGAQRELLKCCGSAAWARAVAGRRPFRDSGELMRAADEALDGLREADWLQAFRHHPKIGERRSAAAQTAREQTWSAHEQAGLDGADDDARRELAELNRAYEEKFGYIFIICAAGRTAAEVLASLASRLGNAPATELRIAAEEQRRITHLRLRKLLGES